MIKISRVDRDHTDMAVPDRSDAGFSRIQTFKAGVIYFLLVFAVGWILGPIREPWAVPCFGRTPAVSLEAVIMLAAMIVSARWMLGRFGVPRRLGTTITRWV